MAVIAFWGNGKIETAQTASMAGITTYLSIEKDLRILLINAKYNDTALQECFWKKSENLKVETDLETGIKGLMNAISSNKVTPDIITNYTRTIFKERLELLTDNNISKADYERQKSNMPKILKMANMFYDLTFIDIEGELEDSGVQAILQESDLIIANTAQRMKYIKEMEELGKQYSFIDNNKMIYLMGRYDRFSKYNEKNIRRTERNEEIYGIPYNTVFFEVCGEGSLPDFIINNRNIKNSYHTPIMESIGTLGQRIIDKLKELQMQG